MIAWQLRTHNDDQFRVKIGLFGNGQSFLVYRISVINKHCCYRKVPVETKIENGILRRKASSPFLSICLNAKSHRTFLMLCLLKSSQNRNTEEEASRFWSEGKVKRLHS
jgi:hypothetical protein